MFRCESSEGGWGLPHLCVASLLRASFLLLCGSFLTRRDPVCRGLNVADVISRSTNCLLAPVSSQSSPCHLLAEACFCLTSSSPLSCLSNQPRGAMCVLRPVVTLVPPARVSVARWALLSGSPRLKTLAVSPRLFPSVCPLGSG